MRLKIILFLLFLLNALAYCPTLLLGAARMGPSNFRYSAHLDGEVRKGELYRLIMPAEILEQCESSCRDMRLFDKQGREVPFLILDNRIPPKKTVRFPLEVISYQDRDTRTKIVLKRNRPVDPVTRLEMESLDRDFNKAVTLSGSNDMKSWKKLSHENIYDFSSRVNLRKMYVTLGKNTYPYFQLMIDEGKDTGDFQNIRLKYEGMDFAASSNRKKKLQIKSFAVLDATEGIEKIIYDERRIPPSASTDLEKRVTEISFRTFLPVSRIEFDIGNAYYYRLLKLYGTTVARKKEFDLMKQDSLYRLPLSTQTETKKYIDVSPPSPYQFYRIVIENDANPALEIQWITLRWPQKQLFFIGLDDHQEYRLFWGSPTVEEVSYDIGRLVREDNWFNQSATPLHISPIMKNTDYKPFKGRDSKTIVENKIFVLVIAVVVIVIGFFLFQLWKKTTVPVKS